MLQARLNRRNWQWVLLLGPVLLSLVAVNGCAKPIERRILVLNISNQLGRSIAEIHRKPCGDFDLAFELIDGSRLAAGESRGFKLPSTCTDVVAYDDRGRIVGEQRGLKMLPGASWILRR